MSIRIAPEDQTLIKELVEAGKYADTAEVIHEALSALEARARLVRLREIVDEADAEVARGDVVEWTPDLMNQLRAGAREMLRLGKPIDPDVYPETRGRICPDYI